MTNLTLQSRVCSIFCSLNLSNSPSARTLSANNLRRRHLRSSLQDGQYEQLCSVLPVPPGGHQPLAAVHQVADIPVLPPLPVLAAHHRLQVGGVASLAVHAYADHVPGLAQSAVVISRMQHCVVSPPESSVTTLSSPPAPSLLPPVPPSPVQLAFVHL